MYHIIGAKFGPYLGWGTEFKKFAYLSRLLLQQFCHLFACVPQAYVCISDNFQKTLCPIMSVYIIGDSSVLSEFLANRIYSLRKVCIIVAEGPGYFMEKFFLLEAIGYKSSLCLFWASHPRNVLTFKGDFTIIFLWLILAIKTNKRQEGNHWFTLWNLRFMLRLETG